MDFKAGDSDDVYGSVTVATSDQKAFLSFIKLYYGDIKAVAAVAGKDTPPKWLVSVGTILGKLAIQVAGHDWIFQIRKDNVFKSRFTSKGILGPEKKINEKLDSEKSDDVQGIIILVLGFHASYLSEKNLSGSNEVFGEFKAACEEAGVDADQAFLFIQAGVQLALKTL